ncbi:transcriptional antiterminator [Enterococcus saigonensis]|uniref:Transcriptional antiterminator n=1 Tax=Enterococcus saigonensis TaxID=1805431 RepID=A0A679INZ0_9ENTE|nr:PRD domain-containing protein [Enterococcus saigonensis]BCA84687.1 transcriptional antiterminator [Enterococcus saigonensis]
MKEKQKALIHYLVCADRAVSSTVLAKALNISPRTVKNYVKEINTLQSATISASNHGYSINQKAAHQLLAQEKDQEEVPDTFEKRVFYYITALLIHHQTLNIFDLEEDLFISASTIRADIRKMNKNFGSKKLRFTVRNDYLEVVGEEKEKRKLVSLLIFAEMPDKYLDLTRLKKHFPPADVGIITTIIQEVTHETKYCFNDFSFANLVLHLLILVESIRNGHTLTSRAMSHTWLPQDKAKLVNEMIAKLEAAFSIELNDSEREELHVLFQVNTNYLPSSDFEEIKGIVGTDLVHQLEGILAEVYQTFGVKLNQSSFVIPFALHLSGLVSRAKEAAYIQNPMLDSVKQDFLIVYMIAVFISLRLGELNDLHITEDETAYIALHVGSELEDQHQNSHKIPTVLVAPKYMGLNEKLYTQLNHNFEQELNILAVCQDLTEIKAYQFDLLLTTLAAPLHEDYDVIKLAPILNSQQRSYLGTEIANVRLRRKRKILLQNFSTFFDERFFFYEPEATNATEILHLVCQKLISEEIVPTTFLEHVKAREAAADTAYDQIAIPHSIYSEAVTTKIALVISKRGILWGGKKIHCMLLPAISRLDRNRFLDIYEALISLFDEEDAFVELMKITNFSALKQLLSEKFD